MKFLEELANIILSIAAPIEKLAGKNYDNNYMYYVIGGLVLLFLVIIGYKFYLFIFV